MAFNKIQTKQSQISFVVWVRAFSAILILLCHLTQVNSNTYISMLSQVFNVGVSICIILSGFLFGRIGINQRFFPWLFKRIKRIYIPFWIFLIVLIVIQSFKGQHIAFDNALYCFLGIHEYSHAFPGTEHTWFITAIMICYLATPIIDFFVRKLITLNNSIQIMIVILLLTIHATISMLLNNSVFIPPLPFYAIAYGLGTQWDEKKSIPKKVFPLLCIGIFAFLVRFVLKTCIDGTVFYNKIVATYTHYIAAFSFFFAASKLFNKKPVKIVQFLNKISFEIYLYHCLFLFPPFSLMGVTKSWILNGVLAFFATIFVSWLMYTINQAVRNAIDKLSFSHRVSS